MRAPVLTVHDAGCHHARPAGGGHSDAAKRLADIYTLHRAAGSRAGWIIVRLADGGSDGTLYESKGAAVAHAHHNEHWCAFIRLGPQSMSLCEAESLLAWHRQAAALRLPDPDDPRGGRDLIPRLTASGAGRQLAALQGRVRLPVALGYPKE